MIEVTHMDRKFYRALPLIPLNPGYDPIPVVHHEDPEMVVLGE